MTEADKNIYRESETDRQTDTVCGRGRDSERDRQTVSERDS